MFWFLLGSRYGRRPNPTPDSNPNPTPKPKPKRAKTPSPRLLNLLSSAFSPSSPVWQDQLRPHAHYCGQVGLSPFSFIHPPSPFSPQVPCGLAGPRYPVDGRDSDVIAAPINRCPEDWMDSVLSAPRYPVDWWGSAPNYPED